MNSAQATTYDDLLPSLVPFETTTARDECVVAVDPANAALLAALDGAGVRARVVAADDAAFAAGQEKSDSNSLQHECSARARSGKSIHASRPLREMIARPKISRNEWKTTEI